MPSCTPPCLLFRPQNFSDYVGIFPTMSHFQGGIFPFMSEFSHILYAGKNLLLVDGMDPRSIWCKKTLWVAVKIFLWLLRESSVICKAISRKSAETFSFFYSVVDSGIGGTIPGYVGCRASATTQCYSRLYPTVRDYEFGFWSLSNIYVRRWFFICSPREQQWFPFYLRHLHLPDPLLNFSLSMVTETSSPLPLKDTQNGTEMKQKKLSLYINRTEYCPKFWSE